MTSQGQRFRRRALRRGYKVDEVDSFLDRVEATLAGNPLGAPVSAQEVHDVVFRVRFGGYDEWQVDLHLDRVERQLAELEGRGGAGRDRLAPPADRMGADRFASPLDRAGADRMRPERIPPERMGPAPRDPMPPRPVSPMAPAAGGPGDPYGRYDEPTYGGGSYEAYEPGRHGKMDMTAEIQMPDRDAMLGRGAPGPGGPRGGFGPGGSSPGFGGEPGPGYGGSPTGGAAGGVLSGDLQRMDALRRTFQPRRFGSGYDPAQVDQLFEGVVAAMSGRGPMPISEAELEAPRFNLVAGGYFEAEVDAALKEVRDILRRR